ncbi:GNAT family N-acetyltransferase [Corynebacterium sp. 5QC2CO]|uniref:GNAT family N-acetyltransferase n=1 Tax=Corynebacterium sp. 5QC2CO TaxID=2968468 RepID=UPI00211CE183|nr:GNAT family N-acetyltransferase [Corynebacterium sp. 5QC2CO]MCQ9350859.1 GNAT family N-acetyltransferase [Corynebacterium sp. 5QC2CO]
MTAGDFNLRLQEAVALYITAMQYNPAILPGRLHEWQKQTTQPGFMAAAAIAHPEELSPAQALRDPRCRLVGIGYCRTGLDTHWWYRQVRDGLLMDGRSLPDVVKLLGNYAELSEIHIHPSFQGRGLGKRLLHELVDSRPETRVLLSTPEYPNEANRAWQLYRQFGFKDVLRNFYFTGDSRPFAVLGVDLPRDIITE